MRLMKIAEREKTIIAETSMGANAKEKFEKLYSMLTMLLRNRPLRLIRGVAGQNGLEAWLILTNSDKGFATKDSAEESCADSSP